MTSEEFGELHSCRLLLQRLVNAMERLSPVPAPQVGPLAKPAGPESLTRSTLSHLANLQREDEKQSEMELLDAIRTGQERMPQF